MAKYWMCRAGLVWMAAAAPFMACAQGRSDAESRPIRVVAPFAPGSAGDIIPRAIATDVGMALRQNLIVDNRPGAGGSIAAEIVARAVPDGHTLLFGTTGVLAINPHLFRKLGYDPLKDFAPIGLTAVSQYAVVVSPVLPVKTLKDYVAYARARPGDLNVGTSGTGTIVHLAGELFNNMTGIRTLHVPYKGSADVMTDLTTGRVHAMFTSLSSAVPLARAGKIRMLAVTGSQRHAAMPDVPTVREAAGLDYEITGFYGFLAPAGTPAGVIARLHGGLMPVLKRGEVIERLARLGADASTSTPQEFTALIRVELAKWARAVKAAGVEMQ